MEQEQSKWAAISGALDCSRTQWYAWQGTYASIFFMTLMPAIWGEQYYFLGPVFILLLLLAGSMVFTHVILRKVFRMEKWISLAIQAVITTAQFMFIYSAQSGFYWYNGGIHYVGMHGFGHLFLSVAICLERAEGRTAKGLLFTASVLLAMITAGSNFVTALQGLLCLLTILLVSVVVERRRTGLWLLPSTLVYIIGFGLNVAGAAIATVIAQAMSVALSLLLIRGKHLAFILRRQDIRFNGAIIGRILTLGSPVALQDLLVNITFLVIIAIANSMGTIPSAGVGVAEKLCAVVMLVPSAYMQSMSAFVAQNIGAGLETRARRALLYGVLSSLMAGLLMGWAAFFHGDVLAGIFADDPAVIAAAWEYLKAYAIDCLLTSFLFCFVGFSTDAGRRCSSWRKEWSGPWGSGCRWRCW